MRRTLFIFCCCLVYASCVQAQKKLPSVPVQNLAGRVVSTESFINSEVPVVLSFWATWCKPCLLELETIAEVYEDWQMEAPFRFIAVSTDDSRSATRVRSMTAGKGWPYDVYLDYNQEFMRALNISSVPYQVVVNTRGEIVYEHSGYKPGDEIYLFEKIKELYREIPGQTDTR